MFYITDSKLKAGSMIMKSVAKLFSLLVLGLVLVGCASSGQNHSSRQQAQVPPQIHFEPAIDVPYNEVAKNLDDNIGVNVRWGGQVISGEQVDQTTTRLTVFAHPLTDNGRPITVGNSNENGGRFIVELKNGLADGVAFDGHFVSFYGTVSGEQVLRNGNKEVSIPVLDVQELVDWDMVDRQNYADDRRGNAYYSLGYRTGHFYSPGRFRYSRFGLGYRSRYNYYGYRGSYSSGFKRFRRY